MLVGGTMICFISQIVGISVEIKRGREKRGGNGSLLDCPLRQSPMVLSKDSHFSQIAGLNENPCHDNIQWKMKVLFGYIHILCL